MSDLRLILLIIGCFIILGVYLWEIFRKKERKRKTDILNAANEISDTSIASDTDFSDEDYNKAISDLTELSIHLQNNSTNSKQFISSGETETNDSEKETAILRGDEKNQNYEIEENILSFYITAKKNAQFNGLAIKKILTDIGMVYGDMNIFHYYKGDIKSNNSENEIKNTENDKPLFSVANMYEPGTFLAEMKKLHTRGIVAFMYDIDSVDSYKIFESVFFVNVELIAKYLDGEINTSDHRLLDATSLKSIREKLRLFAMKDFLTNVPK